MIDNVNVLLIHRALAPVLLSRSALAPVLSRPQGEFVLARNINHRDSEEHSATQTILSEMNSIHNKVGCAACKLVYVEVSYSFLSIVCNPSVTKCDRA